jgi:hypothetical protein
MAHSRQHLAGQCVVTDVVTKAHRVSEMPTSRIGVTHVVGDPPCQLVEFGYRCEQVPAHVVAILALTKQWEHVRGQIVGDG